MLIVQKYGGSSVADNAKLFNVAERIAKTVKEGHSVVVVVSAQGKTTDYLINLSMLLHQWQVSLILHSERFALILELTWL